MMALSIVLSSFLPPQDAGRVPIAPAQPTGSPSERVLESLRQATEALRGWRSAAESGAAIDPEEVKAVGKATEIFAREMQALHGRMKAQQTPSPKPERAEPAPDAASLARMKEASEIARAWTDDARSLGEGSKERRERALAAVREALTGNDPTRVLAALDTLRRIGDVEYDKASFRPLVLPYAREAKKEYATAALYALLSTVHEPGDLALVQEAWLKEPEALRNWALHLLASFGDKRLEGRSEEIALELLAARERNSNQQFSGLWGTTVGPRLEARLLELARGNDDDLRHAAIYFGLSTLSNKSAAVVDALVATLSSGDTENAGRALWGLGQGVPPELQTRVAAALVDLHNGRSDAQTRETCARLVQEYGGPAYQAKLKK
jgi:hypothetical protein